MTRQRLVVAWLTLILAALIIVPTEAQGRFWVLVNGALRYTGPVTIIGNLTQTGTITSSGAARVQNVTTDASGGVTMLGRSSMGSPADGLFTFAQNSFATVGYQMNVGTAAPTATSCGTGAVTAHSNNMAGQITATGATTCTVTFGAPNWSFTPFCTATDVTTAAALRISAASASAITVTGLTSGDVFNWVCGGGAF